VSADGDLDGRVALVSGGARGLGAAVCEHLVSRGCRVVIGDLLVEEGEVLASGLGSAARFASLDVTDEQAWDRVVSGIVADLGRLDVLVNNAGIGGPTSITRCSLRRYQRIVEVNQTGTFLGMREALRVMVRARRGSVVNVASIEGIRGMPGFFAYCGSKHAVVGMTKSAALEVAEHGVRVNAVCPGPVDTPGLHQGIGGDEGVARVAAMVPLDHRLATPAEVARLIGFLAGDESSFSTGSIYTADGGWTAGA
jgi:3alpha(or 20beta)-hydroxysteroid dehydrogenase